MSFSCKNEQQLNDGTPIIEAVKLFKNHPNVFAIGVNCTHPKFISGLIKIIKPHLKNKSIVVYPNAGLSYNATLKVWLGTSEPIAFSKMAKEWITLGADIIGGCCQIGPNHIRSLD